MAKRTLIGEKRKAQGKNTSNNLATRERIAVRETANLGSRKDVSPGMRVVSDQQRHHQTLYRTLRCHDDSNNTPRPSSRDLGHGEERSFPGFGRSLADLPCRVSQPGRGAARCDMGPSALPSFAE